MYGLPAEVSAALSAGVTVLVPNRQRAAAVRLAWASAQLQEGRSVWATPDVIAWDAWLARELQRARHRSGEGRVLLNASQELELWRRVLTALASDPQEASLQAEHASGIARAAALAREWNLAWPVDAATEEAALLARALDAMDALCGAEDCVATSLLRADDLEVLAPTSLLFAGFDGLTPRQAAVAAAFTRAGRTVTVLAPGMAAGAADSRSYGTSDDEAAAIAQWCRDRLGANPTERLLVICADARVDPTGLQEVIGAAVGADAVALEGGEPLTAQPVVRAALAVLALGEEEVTFAALSEVLLSPYVSFADAAQRLRLEVVLRDRLPERGARTALVDELARLPEALAPAATALAALVQASAAVGVAGPLRPMEWIRELGGLLELAGHPGAREASSVEMQAWRRWQAALEEFASLGAVLPPLGASAALGRLDALLMRSEHRAATGDSPVTVTTWRGDPVVRYDGVWVAGLSESQWPEAPRLDPFIPVALQREAGLPGASSGLRLAAARSQRDAWSAAALHSLRLSFSRTNGDIDEAPSVLLHDPAPVADDFVRRPRLAPGQGESRPREPSLPAASPGGIAASAGSRLPELQRECPFHAQAELRLGARELTTPRVGIDARLRGLLLHRALQVLWERIRSGTRLHSRPLEAWQDEIDAAVEVAFATAGERFGSPPTPRQQAREMARCRTLLAESLALEWNRATDFTVEASESRITWPVAGTQLRLRLDRLDRLPDGSRVVVDYKSGRSARLELLDAAARPVQLLTYLDAVGGDVAGLALMKLSPGASSFDAVEDGRAGLPHPPRRKNVGVVEDWNRRVDAWRADVRGLVERHLAGDARVAPLKGACERCPLPGLCRIDAGALQEALDAPAAEEGE